MPTPQFAPSGKVVEDTTTKKLTGTRIPGTVKQPAANPMNDATQAPYKVSGNTVTGYVGTDPIYKNYADSRNQPLPNTPPVVTLDANEGRLLATDEEDGPTSFEDETGKDLNAYLDQQAEVVESYGAMVPNAKFIHDDGTITDIEGNPESINVPDDGDTFGGGTMTANRERAEDPDEKSDGREDELTSEESHEKATGGAEGADDESKPTEKPHKAAAKKAAPKPPEPPQSS